MTVKFARFTEFLRLTIDKFSVSNKYHGVAQRVTNMTDSYNWESETMFHW